MRLQDLLFQSAGALVEDGEEFAGQPLNLVDVGGLVHVRVPGPVLRRHRDLILRPLARQVDADTRHDGRGVPGDIMSLGPQHKLHHYLRHIVVRCKELVAMK